MMEEQLQLRDLDQLYTLNRLPLLALFQPSPSPDHRGEMQMSWMYHNLRIIRENGEPYPLHPRVLFSI